MHARRWLTKALAAASCAAALIGGGTAAGAGIPVPAIAAATSWRVEALRSPAGSVPFLQAISCPTRTFCMAVGSASKPSNSPIAGPSRALVETYNGSTWTVRHPITPAGTTRTALAGVSCPTADECTVIGSTGNGNIATIPLAETWSGRTLRWRVEDTVNPNVDTVNQFFSVSCPSTTRCIAVGAREGAPARRSGRSGRAAADGT